LGIAGSVEQGHWAALRHPEQRRLLASDRVKDGLNIVHALLKREIVGASIGHAGATLIKQYQAAERGKTSKECTLVWRAPQRFDI